MASGPITSWQIVGETMETVKDLIFVGSKITSHGDCSLEITRYLLLEEYVMRNAGLSRETGISGNFVGRIQGAKCPFDLQFLTWDFS